MKGGRGEAAESGPLECQGSHEGPQMSGRHLLLEGAIACLMRRWKVVRAILLYFQAYALTCYVPLLSLRPNIPRK